MTDDISATQAASEGRFQTAGDASPVGFALCHPVRGDSGEIVDFEYAYVNSAGARMYGRTPSEIIGGLLLSLEPDATAQGKFGAFSAVMETGDPDEREYLFRTSEVALTLQCTIVRVGSALAVTFADVTEWRRAQSEVEELRDHVARAERRAARILEQVSDAHVELDQDFRILSANPAAERSLGWPEGEMTGRPFWKAFPVSTEAEQTYERVLRERVAARFTQRLPVLDHEVHLEIDAFPTEHGGVAIVWRDITARIAAEEFQREFTGHVASWNRTLHDTLAERDALLVERDRLLVAERTARALAESANRSKGEFLATMSHELRTPLNAIDGYASLIEMGIRGPVTPEMLEDLRRIRRSQRHLLGLIDNVLDYVRVDSGVLALELGDVPVRRASLQAEMLVDPMLRAKGLVFVLDECPKELSARADPDKLQQVLVNLLGNAVKFTKAGGTIRMTCAGDAEHVTIAVSDTGIGIPEDQCARIFDPFVQVHSGWARSHDGLGLGLSISRDLVRRMGGELTVQSEVGVGSTFTATLPRA